MMKSRAALFFGPVTIRNSRISYTNKAWLAGMLILTACLTGPWAAAEDVAHEDIVVHASGFANDRGQAIASLFREGEDVFHKPYLRAVAKIEQGKATLVFPHLEYGNYAIIVFHDENGNNDLDHNILHFPAEPLGYSNGFRFTLFSGMPNFNKLHFAFGAHAKPIEIAVK